jgi:plastocyanin
VSGLLTLIAAGAPSKVPFYLSGAVLAGWALVLSLIGLRRPDFPGSQAVSRATMAITAVLVAATMVTGVTTATKPEHPEHAERPASPEQGQQGGASGGGPPPARAPGESGEPAGGGATIKVSADPSALAFAQKSLTANSGQVRIEFTNPAPVAHDVRIEGAGGRQIGGTRQITNSNTTATATLAPGRYTFYCSVPGHRQAGMQGPLTVG